MRTRSSNLILLEEMAHHDKRHYQAGKKQRDAEEESDAGAVT